MPLEKSSELAKQKPPAKSPPKKSAQTQKRAAQKNVSSPVSSSKKTGSSVYEGQPIVNETELGAFLELLPRFRAWARSHREEAHPVLNKQGKPDFLYSPAAAAWVETNGFSAPRFFCVMGRMAAALAIIEEGNDDPKTRPADMPSVDGRELSLARKHLGELLTAGGNPGPIR